MVVYVVGQFKIKDADMYRQYASKTGACVKAYGGKFLTKGDPVSTIEGEEFKDRMTIIEFPSKEAAMDMFHSSEYQEIAKLREASAESHVIIQEGTKDAENPALNI